MSAVPRDEHSPVHAAKCAPVMIVTVSQDARTPETAALLHAHRHKSRANLVSSAAKRMAPMARLRMFLVVMSIGAGSMFLLSLDSVVDNLQPVAAPFLYRIYESKGAADIAWEWIVSSRIYGLAVGCFVALLLANFESRKRPLIGALLLNFAGGIMSALVIYMPSSAGVVLCCVGRFICGVGCGVAQVVGSAMLAEIPPIHSRGTFLATLTVWSCMGELGGMLISLDALLGRPSTWHVALAAPSLIAPFILFVIALAPDSPRSLLIGGRRVDALAALKFYQCSADWRASLADINAEARSLARAQKCDQTYSGSDLSSVIANCTKNRQNARNYDQSWEAKNTWGSDNEIAAAPKVKSRCNEDDADSGHHSASNDGDDENDESSSGDGATSCDDMSDERDAFIGVNEICRSDLPSYETAHNKNVALDYENALPPRPPAIWQLMARRLKSGTFVRPLALGVFVLTFAHLDDWLWISYSTQVFENVGMRTSEAQRASLLMSFPQALISLLLLFGFDEFSRRWLLIWPTLASIVISLVATTALVGGQANFLSGILPLKHLIAGIAALDLSAAAIASESAYTVVPELFSQTDRILGSAIIGFTQNFFGGFLTTFALSVINVYGTHFVLSLFAAINVLYVVVIYKCLPETSGKSFHKISQNFNKDLPRLCLLIDALLRRSAQLFSAFFGTIYRAIGAVVTRVHAVMRLSTKASSSSTSLGASAVGHKMSRLRRVVLFAAQFTLCALFVHLSLKFLGAVLKALSYSTKSHEYI